MSHHSRLVPALAIVFAMVTAVSADTVELSVGGHLTGQVKRKGNYAVVKVDDAVMVAVSDQRVDRVIQEADLTEYRRRAEAAGDDAERHYQLALWCRDNVPAFAKLYQRRHMERAIAIDPDHSKARVWLGYKLEKGDWILKSELMRSRGMVYRSGHWVLPEAAAISESRSTANVDAKKWIREIKRLVVAASSNHSKKASEALGKLAAIEDPRAADAVAMQLEVSRKKNNQARELRKLWVQLLGKFRNRPAVEALVMTGVKDDDAVIREAALDQLVQFGAPSAVATYVPMLKSNNNDLVNRAARALAWFPDSELALVYVDALVTEHKTVAPAGPGMSVGFGNNGNGGLSMGGKPTQRVTTKQNPAVLALLRNVEADVDYGYDKQQWRRHFADKRGHYSGDLRRDP